VHIYKQFSAINRTASRNLPLFHVFVKTCKNTAQLGID